MTVPTLIRDRVLASDCCFEPVAAVVQEGVVESVHRGALAVVDRHGRRIGGVAGSGLSVFLRSAAKPFQTLAVVESGAAEAFSMDERELAVMCGSHAGRAEHVEVVQRLLGRMGVPVEALACGSPTHMCSGKHAGMIAIALHLGVPVEGYQLASHPVQKVVAGWIGMLLSGERRKNPDAAQAVGHRRGSSILAGIDGCGVPMINAGLSEAAHLYALLAAGATVGLARVRDAMLNHPEMVAGEGRFDTSLVRATGGGLVAKTGAEGIFALGLLPRGEGAAARPAVGIVLKVADGASRVVPALVKSCLEAFSFSVADDVFARARARTPEGIRGLVQGQIMSLVAPTEVSWGPRAVGASHAGPHSELSVAVARGDERQVLRFLRREWPAADAEAFGRPLQWVAEPYTLVVKRGRNVVAVLRGRFTGGVGTVDELLVSRDERGAGIGSLLMSRFEAEGRTKECRRVVLRAVKDGDAERFYGGLGYRRETVERGHEFGCDYVRLTKELPNSEAPGR